MHRPADPAPERTDPARHAELVRRIAADEDRAAFEELFAFFAPRIKSFALKMGADPALADEVAQDVMMTVWRKATLYDSRQASVATWIYTIARNRRIDLVRRMRRPEIDPNDPTFVPDPEPQPDETVSAHEREARLRHAITELPPEQAELLAEAFEQGLSHSEIAAKNGLPLGTVKSRVRLALAKLRKALEGEE